MHEKFSYEEKANDIALLKLDKSLDFEGGDKSLQPICLAKLTEEFFDDCHATGFGFHDAEMLINDYKLYSVEQAHQDSSKCNNNFMNYNQTFNLCVGGILNHGTCRGKGCDDLYLMSN